MRPESETTEGKPPMPTAPRSFAFIAAILGTLAVLPQAGRAQDATTPPGGGAVSIAGDSRLADNDSNSCRRAYNGVCDEGRYGGTNKCDDGTDTADCRGRASRDPDHGPNSCRRAFNGVCDEGRYGGTNRCTDGTDTADCSRGRRSRGGNNGWNGWRPN
jgi:hypothetical protein